MKASQTLIAAIHAGDFDEEDLEAIQLAIQSRRKSMALKRLRTFKVGDKARIAYHARPVYLQGLECEIAEINSARAVVTGLPGRFAGQRVKVPAVLLQPLDA